MLIVLKVRMKTKIEVIVFKVGYCEIDWIHLFERICTLQHFVLRCVVEDGVKGKIKKTKLVLFLAFNSVEVQGKNWN